MAPQGMSSGLIARWLSSKSGDLPFSNIATVSLSRLLILGVIGIFIFRILISKRNKLPKGTTLPPGPPGKPIVGNIFDVPPKHSWLKFKEWSDQYGPLMRLDFAGSNQYLVSNERIANDLLKDRGSLYSSREQAPAAASLLSGGLRPLLLPYNDLWRKGRRLMHQVTNTTAAARYQPTQIIEATRMLGDLVKAPNTYEDVFERYASGVIFRLAFGQVMNDDTKELKRRIMEVNHILERVASPGAYLVDTFPILMHLPRFLAPFKSELEGYHKKELELFRELMQNTKTAMQRGVARPCWEQTLIEEQQKYGLSDDEGAYVIGTLFEAGSGTTAAAMMSFTLAMVLFPEWQRKVQDEIDRVVGEDRLPSFDDISQLPSVRAVVKETLRWRPVTAGGVPHQLVQDDVYEGHFIPAGTNIHANQWAIHRDPELYPDPEVYNPDRWLNPKYPTFKEPLSVYPNLQNYSCFGFGRRICPGQNIAERSLNIQVGMILWACDISKARDSVGNEIDPPFYDYTVGFNTQPKWFPFSLKVRSPEKGKLIESEYEGARKNDPFGGW